MFWTQGTKCVRAQTWEGAEVVEAESEEGQYGGGLVHMEHGERRLEVSLDV